MDEDDDFFGDVPNKSSVAPSVLLTNIVSSAEADSRLYKETSTLNGSNYQKEELRKSYENDQRTSSVSSISAETTSPISKKPPLPPAEANRFAHSYGLDQEDSMRNDQYQSSELRLDLSNLQITKTKKKRAKKPSKKPTKSKFGEKTGLAESMVDDEVNSKIKVPTGSPKKIESQNNGSTTYYSSDEGDSCSTCQSSSSSSLSPGDDDNRSEQSDVTSVSPLNSPFDALKNKKSLSSKKLLSVSSKTGKTFPAPDDLFRLMKRLIDDVDQDNKIAKARGQQAWANYTPSETASNSSWSVNGSARRHPTLGDIIQSYSKYSGSSKSVKSSGSAAPSVASGTSGFTSSTTASRASSKKSNVDIPRRRHHAAINRDKRQREIAADNLRLYQRLQSVQVSPYLSREKQLSDWQKKAGFGEPLPRPLHQRSNSRIQDRHQYGISSLTGLISAAGRGGKPTRPQSAVAYMNMPPSRTGSVESEQFRRSKKPDVVRPSSGSIHGRSLTGAIAAAAVGNSTTKQVRGKAYLDNNIEYYTDHQKKRNPRPISGHI